MNKVIIFIGSREVGKSSLISKLKDQNDKVNKTQSIEWSGSFIDTPGEFLEVKSLNKGLIVSSYDADIICFVCSVDQEENYFPPNFASLFNKKTIGIVTKVDLAKTKDINKAEDELIKAGVSEIHKVNINDENSVKNLKDYLMSL